MYKFKNYIFFGAYLIVNPKLVKLALVNKIYLPVYVQFEWLKDYKIGTVIDAGAHFGTVSHSMHLLFPKAQIYAFEPDQKNHSKIRSLINKDRLTLESFALSNIDSKAKFYNYNDSSMSSLLPLKKQEKAEITNVKTITLDTYFKKTVLKKNIFLKIDTQGAEELILKGAKSLLKDISIIHVETFFDPLYKNQTLFANIYDLLIKHGFKYKGEAQEAYFYPRFGPPPITNSIFIKSNLSI